LLGGRLVDGVPFNILIAAVCDLREAAICSFVAALVFGVLFVVAFLVVAFLGVAFFAGVFFGLAMICSFFPLMRILFLAETMSAGTLYLVSPIRQRHYRISVSAARHSALPVLILFVHEIFIKKIRSIIINKFN
jgi:hypothetical protein